MIRLTWGVVGVLALWACATESLRPLTTEAGDPPLCTNCTTHDLGDEDLDTDDNGGDRGPGDPTPYVCGGATFDVEIAPTDMLLVLDRSCSMRSDLDGTRRDEGPNKWTYSVDAIVELTAAFETLVRWGLILFPDKNLDWCGQSDVAVPVGADSGEAIRTLLSATVSVDHELHPDGPCVTNIDTAMAQASGLLVPPDDTATFAVLITDGRQDFICDSAGGDSGTEGILAAMVEAGVRTYIVGFGGEVDAGQLETFATLGGTARDSAPAYYEADSPEDLLADLDAVTRDALGCTFALSELPAAPELMQVAVDGNEIPAADWEYRAEGGSVVFVGDACDALLLAGQVTVTFYCR